MNRYAYVNNNPVDAFDPDGLRMKTGNPSALASALNAMDCEKGGSVDDFDWEKFYGYYQIYSLIYDPDFQQRLKDFQFRMMADITVGFVPMLYGMPPFFSRGGLNWSWKSTKTFGHTFKTHGAGVKNLRRLLDRARTSGQSPNQGQWLNNEKAAKFLKNVRVDGPASIRIPEGLGQVIHSDGTVSAAQWARVVPNPGGGFFTAFPIVP